MIFFRGPLCLVLFHCFKNPNVFYYHAIKCSLVKNWDLLTHIRLQAKFFFWGSPWVFQLFIFNCLEVDDSCFEIIMKILLAIIKVMCFLTILFSKLFGGLKAIKTFHLSLIGNLERLFKLKKVYILVSINIFINDVYLKYSLFIEMFCIMYIVCNVCIESTFLLKLCTITHY